MSDQEPLNPLRRIRCIEADVHRGVTNAAVIAAHALRDAHRLSRDDFVLSGPAADTEGTRTPPES